MNTYSSTSISILLPILYDIIQKILAIIGAGTIIRTAINLLLTYRDLRRIEASYKQAVKFAKKNLEETSYTLNKLPEEIIVETTYKGEKTISHRFLTVFRKFIKRIQRKRCINIIIFSDMSYPEQLAFIIKKTFDTIFPFEKVLEAEFREAILSYYAYKFAVTCGKLVGRDTIKMLEQEFQRNKYKEIIAKLDSKKLEEQITLNPPPEVRPLLDRVIIPILELKSREMEPIHDISTIELTKTKMKRILTALANGLIAVLFIGIKRPEEYINYVKERISEFKGLLACSRGKYTIVYEKFLHNQLIKILKETYPSTELEIEYFEGKLTTEKDKEIYYKHVLFIDKKELET